MDVFELESEFWGQKPRPNPDVRRFLRAYRRRLHEWLNKNQEKSHSPFAWGREGQIALQLLNTREYFYLLENSISS